MCDDPLQRVREIQRRPKRKHLTGYPRSQPAGYKRNPKISCRCDGLAYYCGCESKSGAWKHRRQFATRYSRPREPGREFRTRRPHLPLDFSRARKPLRAPKPGKARDGVFVSERLCDVVSRSIGTKGRRRFLVSIIGQGAEAKVFA